MSSLLQSLRDGNPPAFGDHHPKPSQTGFGSSPRPDHRIRPRSKQFERSQGRPKYGEARHQCHGSAIGGPAGLLSSQPTLPEQHNIYRFYGYPNDRHDGLLYLQVSVSAEISPASLIRTKENNRFSSFRDNREAQAKKFY